MKELKILEEIIILEWEFIRERRLWMTSVRSDTWSVDDTQI